MTGQISDTIQFADLSYTLTGIRVSPTGAKDPAERPERDGGPWEHCDHGLWEELFDPTPHGLAPVPLITACWRGYICHYGVTDERLYLDSLEAFVKEIPAAFLGTCPSSDWNAPQDYEAVWSAYYSREGGFKAAFNGLHCPLGFTGELLAGRGFINEPYFRNRAFQKAFKFRDVRHFTFSQGRLTDHRDRSQEAAAVREYLAQGGELQYPDDYCALAFDPWAT